MSTTAASELVYLSRALKAPRIKAVSGRLAQQARDEGWDYEAYLAAVLSEEVSARDSHGGAARVKAARFPAVKTLDDFDFTIQTSVNRQLIAHLAQLDFLAEAKNIVFLGPPGTGKTHLSIALAVQAARRGHRVAFATAHQWVNRLGAAKRAGRLDEELERLGRMPLLVVDEAGYIPFDPEAASLFFALISSRYLVVWSTVAEQQGGSVGGYTPGAFAAYYIVWTLVRNMNIVFTPYGWEERIREGQLSAKLLRPLFPIVEDLGFFLGWKFVVILMWLPIAAVLVLVFHPQLNPSPLAIAVFAVAIWGAYLIRSLNQSSLGLITFWTTRVGPIFQLYIAAELLLSGRLVPMSLMPDWVQGLADLLPFRWTFGFPIEALVGNLSQQQLLGGLAAQLFWIAAGSILVRVVWRYAIRRYSAVSG